MGTFLQTLFVGLRLGSVYALIALGYTMVYGIIRLINFAHGDFIMVGGYTPERLHEVMIGHPTLDEIVPAAIRAPRVAVIE